MGFSFFFLFFLLFFSRTEMRNIDTTPVWPSHPIQFHWICENDDMCQCGLTVTRLSQSLSQEAAMASGVSVTASTDLMHYQARGWLDRIQFALSSGWCRVEVSTSKYLVLVFNPARFRYWVVLLISPWIQSPFRLESRLHFLLLSSGLLMYF